MRIPRGLLTGTAAALSLAWAVYLLAPGRGLASPLVQSGLYLALLVLTARSRRLKVMLVRAVQHWVINPIVRVLLAVGINPLGLALLETTGRTSGRVRRTPVGNGRVGQDFWIIAEHGLRAGYVRNIQRDPRVRVRLRVGWRYRWLPGIAAVLPEDDPLARQRHIVRWHPLRALNAVNVRVLGADLVTVRVRLDPVEQLTQERSTQERSTQEPSTQEPSTRHHPGQDQQRRDRPAHERAGAPAG
jgi:deazaflavin-dependent oxidoreductase (nitroreductase family)